MGAVITVGIICALLYCVCRVAVKAPMMTGSVKDWLYAMLGTFIKLEDFTMMKKIIACSVIVVMLLVSVAYATEPTPEPEATPIEEELTEDVDISEAAQPDEPGEEDSKDVGEESGPTPVPDYLIADSDPDITPPPDEVGNSDEGLAAAEERYAAMEAEEPTPTPEPTPDPELMTFEEEALQTLGEIEGLLIFFAVMLLIFFAYRVFKMFF